MVETPQRQGCFILNTSLALIDENPYTCEFQMGDGRGGTEVNMGQLSGTFSYIFISCKMFYAIPQ